MLCVCVSSVNCLLRVILRKVLNLCRFFCNLHFNEIPVVV